MIAATLVAPSAALSADVPPPCAACIVLSIESEQLRRLVEKGLPEDAPELIVPSDVPLDLLTAAVQRGARVWLAVTLTGELPTADDSDIAGVIFGLSDEAPSSPDQSAFAIKKASSAARGRFPSSRVALRASVAALRDLASRGIGPYVDVLLPTNGTQGAEVLDAMFPAAERWREISAESVEPVEELIAAAPGTSDKVVLTHTDPLRTIPAASVLSTAMPPGLTAMSDVRLQCDGCRADVWLHPETLEAIAVVRGVSPVQSFTVQPTASAVRIANVERGTTEQASFTADTASGGGVRVTVAPHLSTATLVVRIAGWRGADDVYREEVRVAATRQLTVEEILARHHAQRARQSALVRSLISSGTTVVTFDVPGFAGPVTVAAATTMFTRGALTEIAQRDIHVNGVALSSDGRAPKLPLIEPERVSTPPLTITLTAAYRYRLVGRERCGDDRDCYVVEFSPAIDRESAFAGQAWIDTVTFGLVRRVARQTNLSGAIVSNEQEDDFTLLNVAERPVWLQERSASFQIYQAAGFRTPIHRVIATPVQDVNPADFDARRARAHASPAVMLRDTVEGLRYLVPDEHGRSEGSRVLSTHAGRRVVTLAFGVLIDPNITEPLPYAGVSYLDFDFLKTGTQFSGFFGGSYGQLAWAVPRFIRRGWQLTGQAFGIGVSYNDRSFRDGRERYEENIRQRPLRFDATVVAPLRPRVQLRLGYEFEYTAFNRGDTTAASFLVPSDAVVHAARIALDVQRGPWAGLLWWNPARRAGWRRWGNQANAFSQNEEDFQRYGVTVGRSWVVSPGTVVRVDGSWMGGNQLDRFSRYSFDGFANRLRGYPSASIRYDRGGILRSVATWTPAPQFRVDGFIDYAAVHDPGFGRGLRSYPGVGAAVELPLPRRMLVAVEWGYGFEARNTDGSRGTHVVKLSGFKIF